MPVTEIEACKLAADQLYDLSYRCSGEELKRALRKLEKCIASTRLHVDTARKIQDQIEAIQRGRNQSKRTSRRRDAVNRIRDMLGATPQESQLEPVTKITCKRKAPTAQANRRSKRMRMQRSGSSSAAKGVDSNMDEYDVFEFEHGQDLTERLIKQRFRQKARQYHWDKNMNKYNNVPLTELSKHKLWHDEMFKMLQDAYYKLLNSLGQLDCVSNPAFVQQSIRCFLRNLAHDPLGVPGWEQELRKPSPAFIDVLRLHLSEGESKSACKAKGPRKSIKKKSKQASRMVVAFEIFDEMMEERIGHCIDCISEDLSSHLREGLKDTDVDEQVLFRLDDLAAKHLGGFPLTASFIPRIRRASAFGGTVGSFRLAAKNRIELDETADEKLQEVKKRQRSDAQTMDKRFASAESQAKLRQLVESRFQRQITWPAPIVPRRMRRKQAAPAVQLARCQIGNESISAPCKLHVSPSDARASVEDLTQELHSIRKSMSDPLCVQPSTCVRVAQLVNAILVRNPQLRSSVLGLGGFKSFPSRLTLTLGSALQIRDLPRHAVQAGYEDLMLQTRLLASMSFQTVSIPHAFEDSASDLEDAVFKGTPLANRLWDSRDEETLVICVCSLRENADTMKTKCVTLHDLKTSQTPSKVVVCVVTEADYLDNYMHVWPDFVYMQLPRSKHGIGYSRFVAKRALTELGVHCMWMLDDNVQFQEHVEPHIFNSRWKGKPTMPLAPLLWASARCKQEGIVLAGFAHVTVTTKQPEKKGNSRFSKAVFIDLRQTQEFNYIAGLQVFEDQLFQSAVAKAKPEQICKFAFPFRYRWDRMHSKPTVHLSLLGPLLPWRRERKYGPQVRSEEREVLQTFFQKRLLDQIGASTKDNIDNTLQWIFKACGDKDLSQEEQSKIVSACLHCAGRVAKKMKKTSPRQPLCIPIHDPSLLQRLKVIAQYASMPDPALIHFEASNTSWPVHDTSSGFLIEGVQKKMKKEILVRQPFRGPLSHIELPIEFW